MVRIAKYVIAAHLSLRWLAVEGEGNLPPKLLDGTALPLSAIVDSGLSHSPALQAAALEIKRQQDLVSSAVNLPNPQVLLQNTNGLFFSLGVQQNLDFPTVYAAQKKLQKETVTLAEKSQAVEIQDQKYLLHVYYMELQYRFLLWRWYESQDSLFSLLADQAQRQFTAGEVDFLQSSYAKAEAAQRNAALIQAKGEYLGMLHKIQRLTGITNDFIPTLNAYHGNRKMTDPSHLSVGNNPTLGHLRQGVAVSSQAWRLERNRALPSLTVGYMNNGVRETTFGNRIYGGIGIPLWFWQYKGRVAAAKKEISASEYQLEAKQLQLNADLEQALSQNQALTDGLSAYEMNALPNADELKSAANRMFLAGLGTYAEYLRTLNDVANIELAYWETWKNYQLNSIYLQYLCGTL
ncbi:MAG: TolC family protein [Bacteroidetes bacterium]|nr:TolC family protein [Bacteroidota bacterium]